MDLSEIGGRQWQGWTLGEDGLLNAPEWSRGLHPGEIRAIPYLYASQAENNRLAGELDQIKRISQRRPDWPDGTGVSSSARADSVSRSHEFSEQNDKPASRAGIFQRLT